MMHLLLVERLREVGTGDQIRYGATAPGTGRAQVWARTYGRPKDCRKVSRSNERIAWG
jgi:hypothetical protein